MVDCLYLRNLNIKVVLFIASFLSFHYATQACVGCKLLLVPSKLLCIIFSFRTPENTTRPARIKPYINRRVNARLCKKGKEIMRARQYVLRKDIFQFGNFCRARLQG